MRVSARSHANGFVLVLCLAVIVFGAILVLMFVSFTQAAQTASRKRLYQDRGVAGIEAGLMNLKSGIGDQLQQNGFLSVASLSSDAGQQTGSMEQGMYDLKLSAAAPQATIPASQTHVNLSPLSSSDDPFRGTQALVSKVTVTATAQRLGQEQSTPQNYNYSSLQSLPVVDVRQIPLSEFSLYSWGGNLLVNTTITPNIGRAYVNGDLDITAGTVTTLYPVTVAGNVNISAGATLSARSSPAAQGILVPVQSTTDNAWLALAKSTQNSTVLTGRDLPMRMVQPATIQEITASPGTAAASTRKDSLRLWHQCSRNILEAAGTITVQSASGAKMESETGAYSLYKTTSYTAGPIILFDVAKVAPSAGRTSFYLASTNANAVVLIQNARTLPTNLSIVTPHPIYIRAGWNDQGVRRATSLITAQRVVAVPATW